MEGGHHQRVLRRHACSHGVTHHPVDVAVVGDVLGVAVVGAERDPTGAEFVHERKQCTEVARHRCFTDEQPHPGAKPLAALLHGQRLVVGADPGRRVRLQFLADEAGCVAVDVRRTLQRELRQLRRGAVDDPGEVHHLGEAEHAAAAHQ